MVFSYLSYYFQKEANLHEYICDMTCDNLKLMLFVTFFKMTDLAFLFSHWLFCKISSAWNFESNGTICRDLKKLIFVTMAPWGIGELGPIVSKCGSLRLGTPSNLKVHNLMRLHKKLKVLIVIWVKVFKSGPSKIFVECSKKAYCRVFKKKPHFKNNPATSPQFG